MMETLNGCVSTRRSATSPVRASDCCVPPAMPMRNGTMVKKIALSKAKISAVGATDAVPKVASVSPGPM